MQENSSQKVIFPPSPDIAKWQMDIGDIIKRIELWLEGKDIVTMQKRDSDGNVVGEYQEVVQVSKPLANRNFITLVKNILQIYIRKDTLFSDLSRDDVAKYSEKLGENLYVQIYYGYEQYGIDIKNINTIVYGIVDTVNASLLQAVNGGTRETFRSMVQQRTTVTEDTKKKSGFLGIFG